MGARGGALIRTAERGWCRVGDDLLFHAGGGAAVAACVECSQFVYLQGKCESWNKWGSWEDWRDQCL
jgi:hypothetical protein